MRSPISAHDCATNHLLAMHAVTNKGCLFVSNKFYNAKKWKKSKTLVSITVWSKYLLLGSKPPHVRAASSQLPQCDSQCNNPQSILHRKHWRPQPICAQTTCSIALKTFISRNGIQKAKRGCCYQTKEGWGGAGEVTVGHGSNLRHPACVIDHFSFHSLVERFFVPNRDSDVQQLGTADFGNRRKSFSCFFSPPPLPK